MLAPDPDGLEGAGRYIARGIFTVNGRLPALAARIEGIREAGGVPGWPKLRLMRFEWDGKKWQEARTFLDNCMNNYPPREFGGTWFMTCRDSLRRMFFARSTDMANGSWEVAAMPLEGSQDNLSEPSEYVGPDGTAHLIFRDQSRSGRLRHSVSRDNGRTWSPAVLTNYPDATSKNFSGRLSNGWFYLINNPDPKSRDPLAISFSRDGWTFSSPKMLRTNPPPQRYRGQSKGAASIQYPHAIEHAGLPLGRLLDEQRGHRAHRVSDSFADAAPMKRIVAIVVLACSAAAAQTFDVVVYGGSPGVSPLHWRRREPGGPSPSPNTIITSEEWQRAVWERAISKRAMRLAGSSASSRSAFAPIT